MVDVCVSAALDAVKEHVLVPWAPQVSAEKVSPVSEEPTATLADNASSESSGTSAIEPQAPPSNVQRVLHAHNFTKALKEISPSSSETLGTLADLRRWNEEFGEGKRHRKKQVWGKDRFGFTNRWGAEGEGRVSIPSATDNSAVSDISLEGRID